MSTFYHAIDSNQIFLFGDFPSDLLHLISEEKNRSKPFKIRYNELEVKARFSSKSNMHGKIYVFTDDKKYVNSYKLFKELTKMSIVSLKSLSESKKQIAENQNAQTEELLHNLTTLNTYSIHDLFSLIPQDVLAKNINTQEDIVKNILVEKPNVSSSTLLQLIKYNLAMKVEFSVFEKTLKENPLIQKMEDSIRSVILSILQIFIADFNHKNITVSLDASEKRLPLDYDSFSVSLYYIFDNAVKYCSRNTDFKIIFKELPDCFSIWFDMVSIRIENNEIEKLCMKNYRSEIAKKINAEGNGIGMFRILKTLKLNDAELQIKPRISNFQRKANGTTYEHNQFRINFKGKQDWFKTKMA